MALLLLAGLAWSGDVDIPTPRGATLKGTIHLPGTAIGTGVVIAPGGGYHKDRPLIVTAAEHLQGAGFVVVRFNWDYFTKEQRPSADLANEQKDFEAAIAFLRARKEVKRILVAGKSLGSLVAVLRTAKKSDDISGLALLTFPIHGSNRPDQPWKDAAELEKVKLPTLIVCGNKDPLCNLASLYALAGRLPQPPEIVIVPGDHGLKEKDDEETRENIELAARALTIWAKRRG